MRKCIFLLAFACLYQTIYSQEIDYAGELVKSVEIPNSPEAAAFEKYGNVGVSMYSGTPNISVPIYTIKGRELNLPVSLSYDASGIKVEALASQVGQGWNLNVGGRISRIANGLPDDYINYGDYASIFKNGALNATQVRNNILAYSANNSQFSSEAAANNYITFLNNIKDNHIDAEPDYYSLNALGISDHITFDLSNMQPQTLNNPRIKVAHTLSGGNINTWTITNEDGAKYFFNVSETTLAEGNDNLPVGGIKKEYRSSWVLTKIESPNKKDIYEFTYQSFPYWNQPGPIAASSVSNTPNPDSNITTYTHPDSEVNFSPTYKIKQVYLTEIKHNSKSIVTFELGSRYDVNVASALKSITIKNANLQLIKKYELNQSYFGATSVSNASIKPDHDIRLKLDGIDIKGSDLNTYSSYAFEYFEPNNVVGRQSYGQDYLGYANGVNNSNTVLYPRVEAGGYIFNGANRDINFTNARKGNLKKITYPTGGTTEFTYESNQASLPPTTSLVDVTYSTSVLSGGNGPSSDCGVCCQDKFVTAPKVSYKIFQITDPGNYDISLSESGNSNGEAYILNRPNNSTIAYDNATNTTFCTPNNSLWYTMSGQPEESSRFFAAGYYQITLVNKAVNTSLTLRVHRLESQTSNANTNLAGLRIKQITNKPELGQLPVIKTYQYTTAKNGSVSSGKMVNPANLHYFSNYQINTSSGVKNVSTLNRVASASGGSQPHVVYSKVYEIEQGNGYIEHNFNTGTNGVTSMPSPPFSNSFRSNYKVGKESETRIFNNSNVEQTKSMNEYYDKFSHSNLGFSTSSDPLKSTQYAYIEQINGSYFIRFLNPVYASWANGPQLPTYPTAACSPSNITCLTALGAFSVNAFTTIASGEVGNILKSETFKYVEDGTVNQVVDYVYNNDDLLQETITTNSDGISTSTKNYYPNDVTGTVYGDMVTENRLNTVVKSESYHNSVKTGTQETAYKKWANNIYLPEYIKSGKDNLTPEERLKFHSYYANGNVKEVSLKNGPKTVYIWGYNETLPIAKIDNASYAEVSSQIANLQLKSNQDDDTCTDLSNCKEKDLRTVLTTLRNTSALSDALVTTYTYDPLVGVTSITDPQGQIIYYQYDDFNRLKEVKDKNGKVLSSNSYHYKN